MDKMNYVVPEIEVIEVQVEAGFAQSGGTDDYDIVPKAW